MPDRSIVRLVGVYDADGSALGELTYFLKARVGKAHCSLCTITHGRVRERADWRTTRDGLPVPFDTVHRDERSAAVRSAAPGAPPYVLAETSAGELVPLLGDAELDACEGSPELLVDAVRRAATGLGLAWPA